MRRCVEYPLSRPLGLIDAHGLPHRALRERPFLDRRIDEDGEASLRQSLLWIRQSEIRKHILATASNRDPAK